MLNNLIGLSSEKDRIDAQMRARHPKTETKELYLIGGFELPAVKVTQGLAYLEFSKGLVSEVRTDWFICLPKVGASTGIGQTRIDHAWQRLHKYESRWGKPYARNCEYLRPFHNSDGWHLHLEKQFAPIVEDLAGRRPYHPAIDALYKELVPNSQKFGTRRKHAAKTYS